MSGRKARAFLIFISFSNAVLMGVDFWQKSTHLPGTTQQQQPPSRNSAAEERAASLDAPKTRVPTPEAAHPAHAGSGAGTGSGSGTGSAAASKTWPAKLPVLYKENKDGGKKEVALSAVIEEAFPHDTARFTEGLFIAGPFLYESTGRSGESSVFKTSWAGRGVPPATLVATKPLADGLFGEGIAAFGGRLFQLTWQGHTAYMYDAQTLGVIGTFTYPWEGWGLTSDEKGLILSDGSDTLRFLDPVTFRETSSLSVRQRGRPLGGLNELEYVGGKIIANVWPHDYLVIIDAASGEVEATVDASGLKERAWQLLRRLGKTPEKDDCLNGVAYDEASGSLLLTGKHWPEIYRVTLKKKD